MSDQQLDPPQYTEEQVRHKAMLEKWSEDNLRPVKEWKIDADGDINGVLGRFRVVEEDEDRGLYEDDEGELVISVVGAQQYANERVWAGLTPEGQDSPCEVRDPDLIEEV